MHLGSKSGRKIDGEAFELGGMAAVGARACMAYNDWQPASAAMLPAPAGTPFNPSTESGQQTLARHPLRVMIAAATARSVPVAA